MKASIRILGDNPAHHLWNNNGTWWGHLTIHHPDHTAERLRRSLKTKCRDTARRRRDHWLASVSCDLQPVNRTH